MKHRPDNSYELCILLTAATIKWIYICCVQRSVCSVWLRCVLLLLLLLLMRASFPLFSSHRTRILIAVFQTERMSFRFAYNFFLPQMSHILIAHYAFYISNFLFCFCFLKFLSFRTVFQSCCQWRTSDRWTLVCFGGYAYFFFLSM